VSQVTKIQIQGGPKGGIVSNRGFINP